MFQNFRPSRFMGICLLRHQREQHRLAGSVGVIGRHDPHCHSMSLCGSTPVTLIDVQCGFFVCKHKMKPNLPFPTYYSNSPRSTHHVTHFTVICVSSDAPRPGVIEYLIIYYRNVSLSGLVTRDTPRLVLVIFSEELV